MSTRIKLYNIGPDNKLYLCRFPANISLQSAFAKGWVYKDTMQKRKPGIDLDALAIHIKCPPLNQTPSAAAKLTESIRDEISKSTERNGDANGNPTI